MLRVGSDFHGVLLNDWWPPVPNMAPFEDGFPTRSRTSTVASATIFGTFLEWERKWDRQWTTLLGVRSDVVWMNTGNVQGYSPIDVRGVACQSIFMRQTRLRLTLWIMHVPM